MQIVQCLKNKGCFFPFFSEERGTPKILII